MFEEVIIFLNIFVNFFKEEEEFVNSSIENFWDNP